MIQRAIRDGLSGAEEPVIPEQSTGRGLTTESPDPSGLKGFALATDPENNQSKQIGFHSVTFR